MREELFLMANKKDPSVSLPMYTSTATEMMTFSNRFCAGQLFDHQWFTQLAQLAHPDLPIRLLMRAAMAIK
jgi:hypothetical protein